MEKKINTYIQQVTDKNTFEDFLKVPVLVNKNNPNWIAPLVMSVRDVFNFEKNPLWQTTKHALFVAYEGQKPVGRIAAFYNQTHNDLYKDDCGYFGFLEFADDNAVLPADTEGVCKSLLATAEQFLTTHFGVKKIMGPLNPTLNYELGVLVEGFEQPPFFMMSHNLPHYDPTIKTAGYAKATDFYAYALTTPEVVGNEKITPLSKKLQKRYSIRCRTIDLKNFEAESQIIRSIYNDAFAGHWGFIPFSEAEFRYMAKDMAQIIDPNLLFVVEVAGEAAGFILALPNMNEALQHLPDGRLLPFGWLKFLWYKRQIRTVRVINVAIRKRFAHLGLGAVLYTEIGQRLQKGGYTGGEIGWVVESNDLMNRIATGLGGRLEKKYRVYEKQVSFAQNQS